MIIDINTEQVFYFLPDKAIFFREQVYDGKYYLTIKFSIDDLDYMNFIINSKRDFYCFVENNGSVLLTGVKFFSQISENEIGILADTMVITKVCVLEQIFRQYKLKLLLSN
jgi:hypothetical protein